LKRPLILILLLLILSACVLYVRDGTRAVHPVMERDARVVYVKTSGIKNAVNVYPVGSGAIPIWCDVKQGPELPKKMLAVCYSDKKPSAEELGLDPQIPSVPTVSKRDDSSLIEEQINPFTKVSSFSVSITPSNYNEFMIFYFSLYKKFCQEDGITCCMTGNGEDFVFNLVMEDPDDVKQLYREIDSVVSYIEKDHLKYQEVETLYNMFSSLIYDKCSFNRWYYDALSAGIVAPEAFMDIEKWKVLQDKSSWAHVTQVDVKLVDYQRIPSGEKEWLGSSLKDLNERF